MLPIYILAGGKSSRFGSDKARAEIDGEALVSRIVRILTPAAKSFTVVADAENKYGDLGLRTIADDQSGLGPMGGLRTALDDLREPGYLLLCSCDMVTLDCAWVEALESGCGEEIDAVAFRGERIEPLFAIYHSRVGNAARDAVSAGRLSPARLVETLRARFLAMPANWPRLAHVNTREELSRFL